MIHGDAGLKNSAFFYGSQSELYVKFDKKRVLRGERINIKMCLFGREIREMEKMNGSLSLDLSSFGGSSDWVFDTCYGWMPNPHGKDSRPREGDHVR